MGFARGVALAPPLPVTAKSKFNVSIFNGTKNAITLPGEGCSWGYDIVSFELVSPDEKSQKITRKPKAWFKNALITESILSGGLVIRKIDFGDGTWQGLPVRVSGQTYGWKIKVKVSVQSDNFSTKKVFWTGKMESKFIHANIVDTQD